MRPSHYAKLCAVARREGRDVSAAEDMVQEALLAAVLAGRTDFERPDNARWLVGTLRNQARMAARSAARRRSRDGQWLAASSPSEPTEQDSELAKLVAPLPSSLKAVAALILSGHRRREIAYLLKLSDPALRQRIVALKRQIVQAGLALPSDLPGLNLDLAYGRIRDALLPHLLRDGGVFASHDPDGHLFIVRRSQKPVPRQLEA
ncbi:RNA polymerase sigma factor [Devosia sp. SL43]|uniref:RNA polymerase sigma factor n=1 Tax=Devosia sp. SL43 TaxID=2806348 RepID=UPI001F2FFC3F|nr:sigma factor [Devosia sp. SL43]UJW84281.1 transcriptional regulator [Devosia sp. SL43]